MQTWAKRGLQTALVTGGLLMLGTGIASADEDVNPDKPASPLDGSVAVPVHIDNNVFGTPLGQKALPAIHRDIAVDSSRITGALPLAKVTAVTGPIAGKATGPAAPVVSKVQNAIAPLPREGRDFAAPLADKAAPVTGKVTSLPVVGDKVTNLPSTDKVRVPAVDKMAGTPAQGNQIDADMVVPVDISGNAVAAIGRAETTNESDHSYGWKHDTETDGSGSFVSGNVVDLDWALPVQVTNNAVAGAGTASAEGTTHQEAWTTGDIDTNGSHSFLGGNVVAPQFATPVQADGNAVAGGGSAEATSEASTSAEAGGSVLTAGADSVGGGNAVPVPVAVPARVNGNAIMGLGKSDASADSAADAAAGTTRTGKYRVPTYVETNGDPAYAAGNVAQPALSGPAMLCGNAGGAIGSADATCDTATTTDAGGTSRSTGEGSVASGAIAAAPVTLPVEGFGNGAAAVGEATADATNRVDSTAGGDSYTRGHDSIVSGTTANAPMTGTADVFANAAAGAGDAGTTAQNYVDTSSGGNTGTTGDNSVAGGNMATAPVNTPGEVYGNGAAGAGGAGTAASESKKTSSGGGNNTDDDYGLAASNLVTTPVATAAQAFGNSAGAVGSTNAAASADNHVTSGGDNKATGTAGLGSGNIGQVPVSVPAQVFGTGASGLAKGTQAAVNQTEMQAGGDSMSDGTHGAGTGNVMNAPVAGAGQVYGESATALGSNHSLAGSQTETEAGGDTETSGRDGLMSGNVASPQALPLAQSFATAASGVGGGSSSSAMNKTEAGSGGDIDTTGDDGYLSGNLVDVPAAAVVQPFGDAVSAWAGRSHAQGISSTDGEVGGTSTTSGAMGSLSGLDATLPAGANGPYYDIPVEVLAKAMTESANTSDLRAGEGEVQMLRLPAEGVMSATELPSFSSPRSMPAQDLRGAFTGVLSGFPARLPVQVPVTDLSADGLPEVPQILPAPARADATPVPGLPGGLPVALPGLPTEAPGLPIDSLNAGLPTSVPGVPSSSLSGTEVTGGLPTEAPALPIDAIKGGLPSDVPGLPAGGVPGGLVNQDLPSYRLTTDLPTDGITGDLPTSGLPIGLPGRQRDLPTDTIVGGLPSGGLPVALPVQRADLPTDTIVGGLPTGDLPVQRDLPHVPAMPMVGDVFAPLSPVSLDRFGGFGSRSNVPVDLTEVTTLIPVIPATGDLTDITTVLPVIPAAPGVGDITAAPIAQAPSVGTLVPAGSEVAAPELGGSSLDSTRAALANLFTTHPIA
ncbi:hypothetical protein [Actinophytocola algeriensis]|uniref:PE-PGRS family protein n=1 Tax=Actinophytocola algeriensis TaxID=1768010 RepID=A0A7W7Q442_9PSEU|nr:hypothetical protein [Actinophytocola algeriensis]MBB4906670.1 hypothetical protein [Actinophytocola algeriensis]MBE1478151.1 hypothetical protein [Actinophytocola algeriensis]